MEELELLMVRANELTEFRIDAVLHEMATTTLCQLPQDEPWTVEEFLDNTQVRKVCDNQCGWLGMLIYSN